LITVLDTAASADFDVTKILNFITDNVGMVVAAGLILLVGLIAYKYILRWIKNLLVKTNAEPQVQKFATIGFQSIYFCLLFITVCAALNIEISSFVAVFSVAGVAVSLAVKDSLTDVAGALQVLMAHPYREGDFVTIDDETGTVSEIGFAYTKLLAADNHEILVPNSMASNAVIHNFANSKMRRLDMVIPIAYEADRNLAKKLICDIIDNHQNTIKDPAPIVRIGNLGASGIDIHVRVWCKNADFFMLKFDLTESVLDTFEKNGIEIPYNKLQVQVKQ